jgi:hypothetical protein
MGAGAGCSRECVFAEDLLGLVPNSVSGANLLCDRVCGPQISLDQTRTRPPNTTRFIAYSMDNRARLKTGTPCITGQCMFRGDVCHV